MTKEKDEYIIEAIAFVLRNNKGRIWKSRKEFAEAVDRYLTEKSLDELIKGGFVQETAPDSFSLTEKGIKDNKRRKRNRRNEF